MSPEDDIVGTRSAVPPDEALAPSVAADSGDTAPAVSPNVAEQLELTTLLGEPTIPAEPEPEPEPEPEHEPEPATIDQPVPNAADAALVEGVGGGLTWVPFACYLGLWVVLTGATAYLLSEAAGDMPARWAPEYVPLMLTGVGLTALGPILSLIVWLVARSRRPRAGRLGLFASAMTRGALVAFFGVAIWLATLFVLEMLAAGGTL